LYEQSFRTASDSMAELEEYWQTNAAVVGERLGLPSEDLPDNQAIVSNGDTFELLGGTFTASVQNNAASWSLQGSAGVVSNGATFPLRASTLSAAVADNEASFSLPGSIALIEDGDTFSLLGSTFTASVAD